jgi:hypothetical protein
MIYEMEYRKIHCSRPIHRALFDKSNHYNIRVNFDIWILGMIKFKIANLRSKMH